MYGYSKRQKPDSSAGIPSPALSPDTPSATRPTEGQINIFSNFIIHPICYDLPPTPDARPKAITTIAEAMLQPFPAISYKLFQFLPNCPKTPIILSLSQPGCDCSPPEKPPPSMPLPSSPKDPPAGLSQAALTSFVGPIAGPVLPVSG